MQKFQREDYLTPKEVKSKLQISEYVIRLMREDGKLDFINLGRKKLFYTKKSVERLLVPTNKRVTT
jgi:predicted site-specific integrase-resolvase